MDSVTGPLVLMNILLDIQYLAMNFILPDIYNLTPQSSTNKQGRSSESFTRRCRFKSSYTIKEDSKMLQELRAKDESR